MVSPWKTPMPLSEDTRSQVVVYFYSDRWIPITCFCLAEAIRLYRKALLLGKEILVFPPDLDPLEYLVSQKSKSEQQYETVKAFIYR